MTSYAVFFYGSLRDPELLRRVLGRETAPECEPATLDDHCLRRVAGEDFPCLVPSPGDRVFGALIRDASAEEVARVRFFEDEEEYALRDAPVRAGSGGEILTALVCFPVGPTTAAGPWSFDDWPEAERRALREAAVEIMAHYEAGTDWSDLTLWPGLKARAAARVCIPPTATRPACSAERTRDAVGSSSCIATLSSSKPCATHSFMISNRLNISANASSSDMPSSCAS